MELKILQNANAFGVAELSMFADPPAEIIREILRQGGCTLWCMHELSPQRKRTLALHERALRFSNEVNISCPNQFSNIPSRRVWDQLVRAADGSSNNLIEADDASSDADFLSKMGIALREVKESRAALIKIRMGSLDRHQVTAERGLENEAGQLAAIYAAIIRNMRIRLERQAEERKQQRKKPQN